MSTAPAAVNRSEQDQESLARAECGTSERNYAAIFTGFMAKGIAELDILPRENVFTYRAWRAKGRQVRRGEHGIRVVSYRILPAKLDPTGKILREEHSTPVSATVFHVSQTDPKVGA